MLTNSIIKMIEELKKGMEELDLQKGDLDGDMTPEEKVSRVVLKIKDSMDNTKGQGKKLFMYDDIALDKITKYRMDFFSDPDQAYIQALTNRINKVFKSDKYKDIMKYSCPFIGRFYFNPDTYAMEDTFLSKRYTLIAKTKRSYLSFTEESLKRYWFAVKCVNYFISEYKVNDYELDNGYKVKGKLWNALLKIDSKHNNHHQYVKFIESHFDIDAVHGSRFFDYSVCTKKIGRNTYKLKDLQIFINLMIFSYAYTNADRYGYIQYMICIDQFVNTPVEKQHITFEAKDDLYFTIGLYHLDSNKDKDDDTKKIAYEKINKYFAIVYEHYSEDKNFKSLYARLLRIYTKHFGNTVRNQAELNRLISAIYFGYVTYDKIHYKPEMMSVTETAGYLENLVSEIDKRLSDKGEFIKNMKLLIMVFSNIDNQFVLHHPILDSVRYAGLVLIKASNMKFSVQMRIFREMLKDFTRN